MGNDKLAKKVYIREYAGSRSVSRPLKRWIDQGKEVWVSGKQGEWCKIGVDGGEL